jgi:hypothetical protein
MLQQRGAQPQNAQSATGEGGSPEGGSPRAIARENLEEGDLETPPPPRAPDGLNSEAARLRLVWLPVVLSRAGSLMIPFYRQCAKIRIQTMS